MWKISKIDSVGEKDSIFHELIDECKRCSPGARLSFQLRNRLEKLSPEVRQEIVNRVKVGCSPLFIACKKGQVEIVEYLISVCGADVEQKGIYEVQEDRSTHVVTPLWCAAVSGKLSVVQVLLKNGADVNAVSDSGSTPVRSACFMTHFEIVKYLVECGAKINLSNYNGGTCLINSVQSAVLSEFLLQHGADVNAKDVQNKTALHYAIQEHRLETTKLLLKYGADYNAKSTYGDDALQMACLKGANRIFDFLTLHFSYSPERLANAHELIGTTFLDEHNDISVAIFHWKEALIIRQNHGLFPKQPVIPPHEAYRYQTEFQTMEELELLSVDLDLLKIQSLLMAERILGTYHKDTIFRLMFRGASYADTMRYQRCIELWLRALEIRIDKDTILYTDTSFTAQAVVRMMIDLNIKSELNTLNNTKQRFHYSVWAYKLLTKNISEMRQLLTIKPQYKRQLEYFDKIPKCITHLIYLMIKTVSREEDAALITELVTDIVKQNIKCIMVDDTLLHLCVSRLNTIRSSYFITEEPIMIFPEENVVKMLLECGSSVNAKNELGWTPLHVATIPYNYSNSLAKLLLSYGAHIDQPNFAGRSPFDTIQELEDRSDIHVLDYINLKCLCAQIITKRKIAYKNQIPKTLENFVNLHNS
ncbi:protein fem-1 homolog CG6966 [Cylas formicarius]|uniref:protein fem-1 homolog CG6966 n=1 Tax=Cylas formicarius TaxID=197179 RepID=UPI002958925A|nr:protein fem-1 homolog CG6966 [Cylas formicarius]